MSVEVATTINQLEPAWPKGTDYKREGAPHIRLLKSTIKATLPNVKGSVLASHTELNRLLGVNGDLQTQLDAKAPTNDAALTGAPTAPTPGMSDAAGRVATVGTVVGYAATVAATYAPLNSPTFTGTPKVPTAPAGSSGQQAASVDYVNAVSFAFNLPGQAGSTGGLLITDGTNASWYTAPHTLPLMSLGVI